jgi:hypothetical protein
MGAPALRAGAPTQRRPAPFGRWPPPNYHAFSLGVSFSRVWLMLIGYERKVSGLQLGRKPLCLPLFLYFFQRFSEATCGA